MERYTSDGFKYWEFWSDGKILGTVLNGYAARVTPVGTGFVKKAEIWAFIS